uniref:Protein RALF-like 22 n=1 Tax=Nicotiana tabacum TaxID=4097 RepID=A0A1S3Z3V2_TOBAC|nr:protein RALF-like 22 [Nicotiana tomentosiformis]XP_016459104.1 PREDICTED: protein RALF-like 22 [Nicotiana tabacum]
MKMVARPIFVVMLLVTMAFAMVAESSLSAHFSDVAVVSFARHSTDGGLDDLTAGHIGESLFEDEEMMMPSESARRTLWSSYRERYISYQAMRRNSIPCNRRGQSYYQCTRMQRIRPYRRGCLQITRCSRRH